MKKLRYLFEALILKIFLVIFKILPLDNASAFGGWLGRKIGPKLGATKRAYKHMRKAMPEKSEAEIDEIVIKMWDHLGRVIGEYPHLEKIATERITIKNFDVWDKTDKLGKGMVVTSAHIGNWETHGAYLKRVYGRDLNLTYRALNNPYADAMLHHARTLGGDVPAYPKSRESGKHLIKALKNKGLLGILIDQKYNEGVCVDFFGMPAMTNPIGIELAQKMGAPLLFVRNKRTGGAHFETMVAEPIALSDANGEKRETVDIIKDIHALLEEWIREAPEQWIWLHRRWKED